MGIKRTVHEPEEELMSVEDVFADAQRIRELSEVKRRTSDILDKLEGCGKKLGFQVEREAIVERDIRQQIEGDIEVGRVDIAWYQSSIADIPGLSSPLPVVAFEIETSWRTRKHIKGDIFNLLYLKPSLGVIVLCPEGDEKVERLRRSVKEYLNRMGLSGSIVVWSEGDVDELWHRIVQRE